MSFEFNLKHQLLQTYLTIRISNMPIVSRMFRYLCFKRSSLHNIGIPFIVVHDEEQFHFTLAASVVSPGWHTGGQGGALGTGQ